MSLHNVLQFIAEFFIYFTMNKHWGLGPAFVREQTLLNLTEELYVGIFAGRRLKKKSESKINQQGIVLLRLVEVN